MATALILTAPQSMTSPAADTPKIRLTGETYVLTSDSFNGADQAALSSRTTDAAKGGKPLPYTITSATTFAIGAGRLTTVSGGTGAMLFTLPPDRSPDVTISCKLPVLAKAAGQGGFLMVRRDAVTGPLNHLRLVFNPTYVSLDVQVDGSPATPPDTTVPVAAGDTVGVREYNGLVQILVNGTAAKSFTFAPGALKGNFAGFAAQNTTAGSFVYDDLLVTETLR